MRNTISHFGRNKCKGKKIHETTQSFVKNRQKVKTNERQIESMSERDGKQKERKKKKIISKNINFNHHPKVNHLSSVMIQSMRTKMSG